MTDDSLADFEHSSFEFDGRRHATYRKGTGPAVIVISEMPGISPRVADFSRRVADIGCTAVMPHLFGEDGRDPHPSNLGYGGAARNVLGTLLPACISREFTVLATGKSSPAVRWLRALAADEHQRCGGPGVGAVGMCFTGGFALAMAVEDFVLAPVLSQPSLPFAITKSRRRSIDISPEDLATVKARCAAGSCAVLGLRFKGDRMAPAQRFSWLREQLGDAFTAIEIPDEAANPDGLFTPHSVLTEHLIDEPGQPTKAALDEVLNLFRRQLLSP